HIFPEKVKDSSYIHKQTPHQRLGATHSHLPRFPSKSMANWLSFISFKMDNMLSPAPMLCTCTIKSTVSSVSVFSSCPHGILSSWSRRRCLDVLKSASVRLPRVFLSTLFTSLRAA